LDWNTFWNAFGAIGTTAGSLITAIAVVIAVKQYKEPLIKRLSIKMTSIIPVGDLPDIDAICISVANTGIRPISITNIYLNICSKNLVINYAQCIIPGILDAVSFPILLQPEDDISMYISLENLRASFHDSITKVRFQLHNKVNILVTDKTNGSHVKSTGYTIADFLK